MQLQICLGPLLYKLFVQFPAIQLPLFYGESQIVNTSYSPKLKITYSSECRYSNHICKSAAFLWFSGLCYKEVL